MDAKRGTIIVGASVAALVAGWFLRSWWLKHVHEEQLESEEKVRDFDKAMESMSQKKRSPRGTNGRHRTTATKA